MAVNAVGREGTARLERCEFFDGGGHMRLSTVDLFNRSLFVQVQHNN
jgi:hypothetical protein